MDLKLTGTVVTILEEQSGTGRNGPWRKQDFILETEGEYPRQVCVTQWGDNIERFAVREGEPLTVHIDIQSREYQGRWYTDVKAWRVEREEPGAPGAEPMEYPTYEEESGDGDVDDDLPF